jgi:HAD superfamily hydrolase (TIGR01509 family)
MSIAFGFDFDHTLGIDNGLEKKAFYRYAAELGRPLSPADAELARRIDDALARARKGAIPVDDAVREFFSDVAPEASGARWREICFALVPELVRPLEGARELLRDLRARGIPSAVLTNGWTPLQQRKIARALGEDAPPTVLVSDGIQALKPDPAAFAALVAALGVPREQVWYVGDNPAGDVGGALAAGLRAAWFDWEGLPYPQDVPPPTLRIGRLRELERLVENANAP